MLNVPLSNQSLRLPEVEYCYPVGIGAVIGCGDGLDLIGGVANIPPHHPLAAGYSLSVAEM
jgi:hypothetical protein